MGANITWSRYADVPPATSDEIQDAEAVLGVEFPRSVSELLMKHQGMKVDPSIVTTMRGRRVSIGSLAYVSSPNGSSAQLTLQAWVETMRRGGYPRLVIPVFDTGTQSHIALDYRQDPASPTVAYVYPDGNAAETGYWQVEQLAESFDRLMDTLDFDR